MGSRSLALSVVIDVRDACIIRNALLSNFRLLCVIHGCGVGVGVGVFLLRDTPTPGTYRPTPWLYLVCQYTRCRPMCSSCRSCLYTIYSDVYLLLEEFRFSLHSSWNIQSVYHTSRPDVGVGVPKNKDSASLIMVTLQRGSYLDIIHRFRLYIIANGRQ